MRRKGILLAGGSGSRLRPLTQGLSKQLLPVFDKPLIYYPLTTLMLLGVREVMIIVNPHHAAAFRHLLGDGSQWGMSLTYGIQHSPKGVAEALSIGEKFLGGSFCTVILGDTIVHGPGVEGVLTTISQTAGAATTRIWVEDPRRYGVVEIGKDMKILSIEEKPVEPRSNYAVPGVYFLDGSASDRAKQLVPSARGELEITDLLLSYHEDGNLHTALLPNEATWHDIGSIEGLLEAGNFIQESQDASGELIGSPDIAAWNQGWITLDNLLHLASGIGGSYGRMIEKIATPAS